VLALAAETLAVSVCGNSFGPRLAVGDVAPGKLRFLVGVKNPLPI
jgi:hypothetical protein